MCNLFKGIPGYVIYCNYFVSAPLKLQTSKSLLGIQARYEEPIILAFEDEAESASCI